MAEIRRRIKRRLSDDQRTRHAAIREQVAQERANLNARARAKKHQLVELRHAIVLLKQEREAIGLSLTDVAQRSGIDKSRLSKLENDLCPNPTLETLTRIAQALGVTLTIGVSHSRQAG